MDLSERQGVGQDLSVMFWDEMELVPVATSSVLFTALEVYDVRYQPGAIEIELYTGVSMYMFHSRDPVHLSVRCIAAISHEIYEMYVNNCPIAPTFDRPLGSTVVEAPASVEGNAQSREFETLWNLVVKILMTRWIRIQVFLSTKIMIKILIIIGIIILIIGVVVFIIIILFVIVFVIPNTMTLKPPEYSHVTQTVNKTVMIARPYSVCFITKLFLTYSFFHLHLLLSTIYRHLSSYVCSVSPETAKFDSSYSHQRYYDIMRYYWFFYWFIYFLLTYSYPKSAG